jgi:hypothetical protein
LKKAAQKLLLCWDMGWGAASAHGPGEEVFLLLFLQKKKRSPYSV